MAKRKQVVVGDFRVQEVRRPGGTVEFTIMNGDGSLHVMADGFLRARSSGTARTYAYLLVDHLRWLADQGLHIESVTLLDLQRYMGALGAEFRGPSGNPWRHGQEPYSQSTLLSTASCLKGFYRYQGSRGVNRELSEDFARDRLPTQVDRRRSFMGHNLESMPANPLAPTIGVRRRHPKLPPEGARDLLLANAQSLRDRLIVTWFSHSGLRVGELCGLHLVDLHFRADAQCGEAREPHLHLCHRENNPNGARVKTKRPWSQRADGWITGGRVVLVSSAMRRTYFEYMDREYPRSADHGMLLVQRSGSSAGQPLSADAVRSMLKRAAARADLEAIRPHAFRHQFATDVMINSNGNTTITREAGGWASARTVEDVYAHIGPEDPGFRVALDKVWGADA